MDPGQSDWLSSFNHNGDKLACTLNNGLNIFCIIAILDESPLSTKFRTLYFSDLRGQTACCSEKRASSGFPLDSKGDGYVLTTGKVDIDK